MNNEIYDALLKRYKNWCASNIGEHEDEIRERRTMCDSIQAYTAQRLTVLNEDDFYGLMAQLWSMAMWGNKHYKTDQIISNNGMPLIRKELTNLLYGKDPIEKRWDRFRENVTGIGPAAMSEILNKLNPAEYILWNQKAVKGFSLLEIPGVPKSLSQIDGKKYAYHSLWDTQIITQCHKWHYMEWQHQLDRCSKKEKQSIMAGTPRDWFSQTATDCRHIYSIAPENSELGRDFLNENITLAEQQILKAGYRLAKVLNDLFG